MEISQIKQLLETSKYLAGKRQTLRMIIESSASIRCIAIAHDAEKQIIASVVDLCKIKNVPYSIVSTGKRTLGELATIKIGCSMICFLK